MENVKIELSDGTIVYAYECWDCCNGIMECGVSTDITDENGNILGTVNARIPDKDDYDMSRMDEIEAYEEAMSKFISRIESEIDF